MSWQKNVYVITGQPGGGKSSVSNFLKEKDAFIIDADQISRESLLPGSNAHKETINHFGPIIISNEANQEIDRKKLAEIILNNPLEKKALEEIIHPEVRKEVERLTKSAPENKLIFYDCPLFFESGQNKNNFKAVIVVKTDEEIAKKRFLKRVRNKNKNISDEFYDKLYKSQWKINEKVKHADFIIENNNGLEQLKEEVNKLWQKLTRVS